MLRLKLRFRVNKHRSIGRQINDLHLEIEAIIRQLTEQVRTKVSRALRQCSVALLTKHVHFRDILDGLLHQNVQNKDEFKWQMQFKFEALNLQNCVAGSSVNFKDSEFET